MRDAYGAWSNHIGGPGVGSSSESGSDKCQTEEQTQKTQLFFFLFSTNGQLVAGKVRPFGRI